MDLELRDRVALVCGASEGMGRGSALVLAGEGARLALVARTRETLEKTAAEADESGAAETLPVVADLVDEVAARQAIDEVVDRFGRIDILVNTVGLCEPEAGGILAQDDSYWRRSYDSVLMTAVRTSRAVVPVMQAQGSGSIVNISAMSARHYMPMLAHYSSMKAALAHFTKNLAREFAHDGIRANAVMPGLIGSEGVLRRLDKRMHDQGWSEREVFDAVNEKYLGVTWADRLGTPEEIGNVVAFLASERASYVNGALVNVDGGSHF